MAGFIQNLLQDAAGAFFGSDYLRDYTHASKTFRSNSYAYTPKLKFLFHTYFDINTQAYSENVGTGSNFGLTVKTVKLPSFSFDTHQLNQYNRKRIVQTKIKYDPVNITFHDDNGNVVRKLWQAYYNYYYKDGSKPSVVFAGARGGITQPAVTGGGTTSIATAANYNARTAYSESVTGDVDWGYIGETAATSGPNPVKIPFFKNITVFGFNQHKFVAYTLINPIVTKFSHDTYNYSDGGGVMEMSMDLDYETVVYNSGALSGNSPSNIVAGFGLEANYDRTVSPIAKPGSNATILGQGGLVDAAGGAMDDLANGNILGAIQKAGTAYNTFKNTDLKTIAATELKTGLQNALNNTPNTNRNTSFDIPVNGSTPGPSNMAGSPVTGATAAPIPIGPNPTAGSQNKGP